MKWLIFFCCLCFSVTLLASSAACQHQVDESVRERKVTVKMMEDRLKCIERRETKIKEIAKDINFPSEFIIDELEQIDHDKRSLSFLINSMK